MNLTAICNLAIMARTVAENQISSSDWLAAIDGFDEIRAAMSAEVLAVAEEVRELELLPHELEAFLKVRAGEAGGE